jgi:type I restriction enzyme M protein
MKAEDLREVQRVLWAAADEMRANSSLAPAEYRGPVLGLVFLAYAEKRFDEVTPELQSKQSNRRGITPDDYRSRGVTAQMPDCSGTRTSASARSCALNNLFMECNSV